MMGAGRVGKQAYNPCFLLNVGEMGRSFAETDQDGNGRCIDRV